ncbi:MAG: Gfo/Idh/MocA family oxidoreductase [Prevotellaceae bacterium]|jgi:predicted dehydrogenase|nr:Gfo/Idh/MocA family oxidoreductase [Prevotellaceae bacterium]
MLNIALVGFGYWGPNIAKQLYNNPDVKICYICDKKQDRLDKAKSIYAAQINYILNYSTILDDNNIDAVAIAVETSTHFHLAKQVLLAGKHIFIEKPLASAVSEAIDLKLLSDKTGKIIHIDHVMMYHPCVQKIKELYNAGEIGEIVHFDASRRNSGQVKEDVNVMWDLAIHDLSILDYLINPGLPDSLFAIGYKTINKRETLTSLMLKFGDLTANIKSHWLSSIKERKIIIVGTKKMVVYDDVSLADKLKIYDSRLTSKINDTNYSDYIVQAETENSFVPEIKISDALSNSISYFLSCVKFNMPSVSGPEQGIRLLKILEKADKWLAAGNN